MLQTIGILGFFIALLSLYVASELTRRATQHQAELEKELLKANARLQKLEGSVFHVEKLAAEIRHQRRRQAETLTALADKSERQRREAHHDLPMKGDERLTPSSHTAEQAKAVKRKAG